MINEGSFTMSTRSKYNTFNNFLLFLIKFLFGHSPILIILTKFGHLVIKNILCVSAYLLIWGFFLLLGKFKSVIDWALFI